MEEIESKQMELSLKDKGLEEQQKLKEQAVSYIEEHDLQDFPENHEFRANPGQFMQ